MKKLYRVNVTYYVAAEDEDEARHIQPDLTASDIDADELGPGDAFDPEWIDAIPFGETGDRTCLDYFNMASGLADRENEAFPDPLFPSEEE